MLHRLARRVVTGLVATLVVGGSFVAADGPGSETPRGPLPPPGFLPGCLTLIENERYDEARSLLQPVVANHPGWAKAHFYLALTYHRQKRYEQARELFRRTLELDPQYQTPRVFYGWCLYYLGELNQARTMFESYLKNKPDYADAIFALGLIDFDDDDIESARKRFLRTIRLSKGKSETTEAKARARLADVHLRTGELPKARAELERSIELNSTNHETYFKLSRVLQRLGDEEGAEEARRRYDEIFQRRSGADR